MAVVRLKRVVSAVDLQKDALLHSPVNRVTFSLTSTFANGKPRLPVCSHRGGMAGSWAWRCKVIADNTLRRCRPPPTPCFRWRCGGGRRRPPPLAGGGGETRACAPTLPLYLPIFPRQPPPE